MLKKLEETCSQKNVYVKKNVIKKLLITSHQVIWPQFKNIHKKILNRK